MKKDRLYNILSIICGAWFVFFGVLWTYWIALFLGYPVGILGYFFWHQANKLEKSPLNQAALFVLVLGLICSIGALFLVK